MRVDGLYADEGLTRLAPTQQVNVWCVLPAAFYCEATVETLPEEVRESPEDYWLEPTTEDGLPIALKDAVIN